MRYKIWVEIEALDKDERSCDIGVLPDCVGVAYSRKAAMARAWG